MVNGESHTSVAGLDAWENGLQEYITSRGLSEGTRAKYLNDSKNFHQWCLSANVNPMMASTINVINFGKYRRSLGRAPNTVASEQNMLKGYYSWLWRQGHIASDPLKNANFQSIKMDARETLNVEQLRQLWEASAPGRDRAAISLLGLNALRTDEVCSARLVHLDAQDGKSVLRLSARRSRLEVAYTVLASETAADIALSTGSRTKGSLFLNSRGNALTRRSLRNIVVATAKRAGLPDWVTPMTLTFSMRPIAIAYGFSYPSVVRSAGDMDLDRLAYWFSTLPFDPDDHAAMKMAHLVLPASDETRRFYRSRVLARESENPAILSIILTGAALECFLREFSRSNGGDVKEENAKLSTYGSRLSFLGFMRPADIQILARIEQIRNDAAHGWFERVSVDDAKFINREAERICSRLKKRGASPSA